MFKGVCPRQRVEVICKRVVFPDRISVVSDIGTISMPPHIIQLSFFVTIT